MSAWLTFASIVLMAGSITVLSWRLLDLRDEVEHLRRLVADLPAPVSMDELADELGLQRVIFHGGEQ